MGNQTEVEDAVIEKSKQSMALALEYIDHLEELKAKGTKIDDERLRAAKSMYVTEKKKILDIKQKRKQSRLDKANLLIDKYYKRAAR